MGFRGQEFAFGSPAAAIAGMVEALSRGGASRASETASKLQNGDVLGRILAEPVLCDRDSPPFDYSAMDGYAVRVADLAAAIGTIGEGANGGGATRNDSRLNLAVDGEARIGGAPPELPKFSGSSVAAIRIATGAAIPMGADAVVRREDVVERADRGAIDAISISLTVASEVRAGDNIRRRGENAKAGATVVEAGSVLTAAALGTLAAVGCVRPSVRPRVRTAVITTGDELVPPGSTPGPYQIRNSNAVAVSAVLGAHAWIDDDDRRGVGPGHVGDEEGELERVLRSVLEHAHAVVLTGGVSMGHRDPVRAAVEGVGAEIVFHGMPQRPGKPMLGAVLRRKGRAAVPIFGLPGNPVSAIVTCTRVVLPVLAALAGVGGLPMCCRPRWVPLANPDGKLLDMWWHRLVRINEAGAAELIDGRGSGDIIAAGRCEGFIELAPKGGLAGGAGPVPPPGHVPFYPWPM